MAGLLGVRHCFLNGFGDLPINAQGGVWALLLLHGSLLAALVNFNINRQRGSVALVWGAWGALWTISTYYVSRSHENNITNLVPIVLLVTAALAHAWLPDREKNPGRLWLWLTLPVTLTTTLWLVLSQPGLIKRQLLEYSVEPHTAKLRQPLPDALTLLIKQCVESRPGPYSVIAPRAAYAISSEHSPQNPEWIPIDSLPLFEPLPIPKRFHYLDIYTGHGRKSGWLISMLPRHESVEWIIQYTNTYYKADVVLANSNWIAWHCVPKTEN